MSLLAKRLRWTACVGGCVVTFALWSMDAQGCGRGGGGYGGGGGGYGPPAERARELVERDVMRGYVSKEAAARDYGVTFS